MGWDEEVYIALKGGVYYVGSHGGEGECDRVAEGTGFVDVALAWEHATVLYLKKHPNLGIRLHGFSSRKQSHQERMRILEAELQYNAQDLKEANEQLEVAKKRKEYLEREMMSLNDKVKSGK